MGRYVYYFGKDLQGNDLTEGSASMRGLLGGKGANLAEMARLGLAVPSGFTLSTELCTHYYKHNAMPEGLKEEVQEALKKLEKALGKKFADDKDPLLVSVRSGSRASMPGMMDTVLNLGLNDKSVLGLAELSGNPRFAWDSYRRFIQMFSDVVLGLHASRFEAALEEMKSQRGYKLDTQLGVDDLKELVRQYLQTVLEESGKKFPQDPEQQLWSAIEAVLKSWMSPRAIHYRRMESLPDDWGTAVNVQAMVFGNRGDSSATGVAFTRDPSTGRKTFYGEFLVNAQGEDVVSGIRTPQSLSAEAGGKKGDSLEELMPDIYKELHGYQNMLEKHYRDMQDIEFTIEEGKLFILQTRNGKRTTQAAVKIAVDMVGEGLITQEEAVMRIDPYGLDQLLHPRLDPKHSAEVLAKGLAASPGAVSGRVVFYPNHAEEEKAKGHRVILVRHETSPEDIHGMDAAVGILTALGGMTSHAAVVARGMGKSCIAGCADISIDYRNKCFRVKGHGGEERVVSEGDVITLDANSGHVYLGEVPTVSSSLDNDFATLMTWADGYRRLKVRANADTGHDAKVARSFGAEGIGLCRTEHMFFDPERINVVRAMILAGTESERSEALRSLFPMQKNDFMQLFKEMQGLPVTIRLLDPPLHEFLPQEEAEVSKLAANLKMEESRLKARIKSLHENNPMLGHRGCRLGISFPEIYDMQARAIVEALKESAQVCKEAVTAEIMVPLVFERRELEILRQRIDNIIQEILGGSDLAAQVQVGTMIEIPRAALRAKEIAEVADFFSFGTNDLTQMALGLSRDDSGRFLPDYIESGILPVDPFSSIDVEGVGELVRMGVERGRLAKSDLKTGICGEHGGDPASVHFFHQAGLDYVSCSPFRVPAARLSAAQAALSNLQRQRDSLS